MQNSQNSQCCVPACRVTPRLPPSPHTLTWQEPKPVPSASCLTLLNHPPENGRKGAGRGNDGVRRKPRNPNKLSASSAALPPAQPPNSRLFSHWQDSRTQQSQTQTSCPSAPALSSPVVTCRQEGEMDLECLESTAWPRVRACISAPRCQRAPSALPVSPAQPSVTQSSRNLSKDRIPAAPASCQRGRVRQERGGNRSWGCTEPLAATQRKCP